MDFFDLDNVELKKMADTATANAPSWRRRHWRVISLLFILIVPIAIFAAWAKFTLSYTYSAGDRAGYVQKISKKGWICKTWEGELAQVNLPGSLQSIFQFSVRSDSIAHLLEAGMGKQVSVTYAEHRGVPTRCFGETNYYITNVRTVQP
jgi:hypothetical protein